MTQPEDLGQRAHYMGSLGKEGMTGVGFVIDEQTIRMAFSPFSLPDGLMLPMVLQSPPMQWRKKDETTIMRGPCITICILQQLLMKQIIIQEEQLRECMGTERSQIMKEVAGQLLSAQAPIDDTGIPHDYFEEIQQLRSEVKALREEVKMLETPPRKRNRPKNHKYVTNSILTAIGPL